jgi:chromate reductase
MNNIHILAIPGSLRKGSFNRGLLVAAAESLPENTTLEIFDLHAIPFYNEDLEKAGDPPAVAELKAKITAADALMIATPEYNHSIPGVLKNALDWASRGKYPAVSGKPLAILGGGGNYGSVRAQDDLRKVATTINLLVLNRPEVAVQRIREKFDNEGRLADEATRQAIAAQLLALRDWTLRLQEQRLLASSN